MNLDKQFEGQDVHLTGYFGDGRKGWVWKDVNGEIGYCIAVPKSTENEPINHTD